jgi:hypothetical protein
VNISANLLLLVKILGCESVAYHMYTLAFSNFQNELLLRRVLSYKKILLNMMAREANLGSDKAIKHLTFPN